MSKTKMAKPKEKVRKPKAKLVNVYISNTTREILNQLKYKYKVSYSAICSVAARHILRCELTTKVKHDKNAKWRTKIKPKYFTKNPLATPNEETIYATNLFYFVSNQFKPFFKELYLKAKEDKKLTEEEIEKRRLAYYNKFLADLAKERDVYYDFQNAYRTKVRVEKQYNKEYGDKLWKYLAQS